MDKKCNFANKKDRKYVIVARLVVMIDCENIDCMLSSNL